MKKQKGFTFIELLAVIVILGILITLATIAISSLKKKQDEKNYLNEISSIFTGAKAYIAEHPERLSFMANGENPYKCSGLYSVYENLSTGGIQIVAEGETNPLYLYLNESIYKLEGNQFKEITERDGDAATTWDSIGAYYEPGIMDINPYKYFLGWYSYEGTYGYWDKNWTAVDSDGIEIFENKELFKEIIRDNNRKVVCTTSANDIGISYRRLEELGYISVEKNSQIYNYLYKTHKLYKKGNLDDRVDKYFEEMENNTFTAEMFDSHKLGLYRCSKYDDTDFNTLNVVYEIYKFDLVKNSDNEYALGDFSVYNDCGCKEQQEGDSPKLCYTGATNDIDNPHCTYWSGGQGYNNWMLSPSNEVLPNGRCDNYK